MKNPDHISTKDACTFLDCNRMTLNRLKKKHKLKKEKISRTSYYLKSELRKYAGEVQENKSRTTKASAAAPPIETPSSAININTHGMKLFDTLCDIFFDDTERMNEVDESKISSLTICQLQIQVLESHIIQEPLDMNLMTSLNRLLKNEEMILRYLPKQRNQDD